MPVHVFRDERNTIFRKLLREGVMVVKKQYDGKHPDTGLDNLKVWMLTRSLCSKGYLEVTYSWKYHYYTVTDEGIEYLRGKLGVTEEDVKPATRKPRLELLQDNRRGRGRGMRGNRGPRFGANRNERGAEQKPEGENNEEKPNNPPETVNQE